MLDTSLSTKFKIDEIQTAAYQFVMGLRPADRVLIVSFDQEIRFYNEPTNDRETLRRAIKQTRFGGGTSLYEAVYQTFERMKRIKGRKAIVLFTDGVDTTSRSVNDADNLAQSKELDSLVYSVHYDTYNDVQNVMSDPTIINPNPVPGSPVPLPQKTPTIPGTNIPFPRLPQKQRYPQPTGRTNDPTINRPDIDPTTGRPRDNRDIIVPGGGTTSPEYQRGKDYLNKLAINTGARFYEADSYGGLSRAFDQIAEDLRQQYSLGYYPAAEGEWGERRRIKVKVNRKKVAVRAREDYIIGRKETKQKKT
jgi:hypothetical protein